VKSRFVAVHLQADPEGVTFVERDGTYTRAERGVINRLIWRGQDLWVERLGDVPILLNPTVFNASAVLGAEASGDPSFDFNRIVEGVRYYAPTLEVEVDRSPAAIDFGPVHEFAETSGPMEVQHDPYGHGPNADQANFTTSNLNTGDMELDQLQRMAGYTPPSAEPRESAYFVPDTPPPQPHAPRDPTAPHCLSCDVDLRQAQQHFLIDGRPWCVPCASPMVTPAWLALIWLAARGAVVAAGAARTYSLVAAFGQPIILAALGATLVGGALGFLLFGWVSSESISGTVERRLGPPGAGGAKVPAGSGIGWFKTMLSQSVLPLAIAGLLSSAVVGASFAFTAAPFPEVIPTFLEKDMEKMLTQMGRDDVLFAQYKEVGKPVSSSGRYIALARGPLPTEEIIRRMFAEFALVPDFEPEEDRFCELVELRDHPAVVFVVAQPCGDDSCVAFGRKVRDMVRQGGGQPTEYDVDCWDEDAYEALEFALTLDWALP
jgi:hypothetical protein